MRPMAQNKRAYHYTCKSDMHQVNYHRQALKQLDLGLLPKLVASLIAGIMTGRANRAVNAIRPGTRAEL
jgi:hypothetical protein